MMGIRQTLNIPPAAKFVLGDGIGVHIAGMFGNTWCEDFLDKDTEIFAPEIEGELFATEEPPTVNHLCQWCFKAAQEEE